jgi:hypothetical protein
MLGVRWSLINQINPTNPNTASDRPHQNLSNIMKIPVANIPPNIVSKTQKILSVSISYDLIGHRIIYLQK